MLKYDKSAAKKKGQKKARSQNFSLTETVIIKYKSRDHPILLQMPEAKHLKKISEKANAAVTGRSKG